MPKTNKIIFFTFIYSCIILFIFFVVAFYFGVRVNLSASYPLGIYLLDKSKKNYNKNDMVLFCPPQNKIFKDVIQNGYLSFGICPGGITPLHKKIVAVVGDYVMIKDEQVYINNTLQPKSKIFKIDSFGKNIKSIYTGGYITPGEFLPMSDFDERSFDGRYFGTIPLKNIIGHLKPIYLY